MSAHPLLTGAGPSDQSIYEEVNDDPPYDQMSDLDDMVLKTPVQTRSLAGC